VLLALLPAPSRESGGDIPAIYAAIRDGAQAGYDWSRLAEAGRSVIGGPAAPPAALPGAPGSQSGHGRDGGKDSGDLADGWGLSAAMLQELRRAARASVERALTGMRHRRGVFEIGGGTGIDATGMRSIVAEFHKTPGSRTWRGFFFLFFLFLPRFSFGFCFL
jgi:hypothetical protein